MKAPETPLFVKTHDMILWLLLAQLIFSFPQSARCQESDRGVSVQPAATQKWAVLVGVNDYAELNDLKYCGKDAEALAGQLARVGFSQDNIFLLHDGAKQAKYLPTKGNIRRQLDIVLKLAESGDLVLVTFSGHGMHMEGKSYLCPPGSVADDPEETMISLDYIYQQLEACQAGQKLIWIDACRNDPRPPGRKDARAHQRSTKAFMESLENTPKGILVLASCAAGQVSWEDEGLQHGVFMHYMLEGLAGKADQQSGNRDNRVSLLELYKYANLNTKRFVVRTRNSVQTPELFGRITGDFNLANLDARPTPPPTQPTTSNPRTITNSLDMKLKLIPAGDFMMGSPESEKERNSNEKQHRVEISRPYYMGEYEVTQGQWRQLMGSDLMDLRDSNWEILGQGTDYPMYWVSWYDAADFCNRLSEREDRKLCYRLENIKRETHGSKPGIAKAEVTIVESNGYRLPTGAEWEYACRAGTTTPFHFGNSLNSRRANVNGNFHYGTTTKGPFLNSTAKVGSYKPNSFGLYDMQGNVWEWCHDTYSGKYDPGIPVPISVDDRVMRGGSWYYRAHVSRSALRTSNSSNNRSQNCGFRIVLVSD